MTRHIGVITTARSDFGCLSGICELLHKATDIRLSIFAGGMHFSARHGQTVDEIRAAGLGRDIVEVSVHQPDDSPTAVGLAMGNGVTAFARAFAAHKPDILILLGDRYDALPAAVAATPANIPIAHLCGGDVTEGQIDEMIRHAITKLSHLHFVSHEAHARRVIQLGEEPWRVVVSGHPSLDGLDQLPVKSKRELFSELDLDADRRVVLFTQHPETLTHQATATTLDQVLEAVGEIDAQILFTYPNSDTGSDVIITKIREFLAKRPDCRALPSLGRQTYFNMLRYADCMVGNSSSGIFDAASFALPVLNIGDRQHGRIAPQNVITVPATASHVRDGLRRIRSEAFVDGLRGMRNPYGDGRASQRIVEHVRSVGIGPELIRKRFHDMALANRTVQERRTFGPEATTEKLRA